MRCIWEISAVIVLVFLLKKVNVMQDWIIKKKDQMRTKGHTNVAPDSKYTGRKRKDRW